MSESVFLKRTNERLFLTLISCLSVEELNLPNIGLLLDAKAKPLATSTEAAYFPYESVEVRVSILMERAV